MSDPKLTVAGEERLIAFKFKDIATVLIRERGIHEGYWSLYLKFGISGANVSLQGAEPVPTAIVPVIEIGIARETEEGPLSVNAAEVNPAPSKSQGHKKTPGQKKAR